MRIVLAPVGTRGDVQPMIALAAALKKRGHDVVLCAADTFRPLAERVGAEFARGGDDVRALITGNGEAIANPVRFLSIGRQLAREQFGHIERASVGADVIVGTIGCAAGPAIAELVGAKFFWAGYQPQALPSKTLPPMLFAPAWLPRWLWPASWSLYLGGLAIAAGGIINDERKKRGLSPLTGFQDLVRSGPWLCAFDEEVSPVPADWDVERHVTGFWFYDEDSALPDELVRFLDDGDAPAFISFGSMPNDDPAATTKAIDDALAAVGGRAIVAAGWGGIGAGLERDGVFVVDGAVNHAALFPRCKVIVHHGGAGTTSQAARAGVPQVVVPHMFDQFHWADRVHALGVGSKPLRTRFTGRELTEAVTHATSLSSQARALAAKMTSTGATTAASLLLQGGASA